MQEQANSQHTVDELYELICKLQEKETPEQKSLKQQFFSRDFGRDFSADFVKENGIDAVMSIYKENVDEIVRYVTIFAATQFQNFVSFNHGFLFLSLLTFVSFQFISSRNKSKIIEDVETLASDFEAKEKVEVGG